MPAIICKQGLLNNLNKRLYKIFKLRNAKTLIKVVLEKTYRVLQRSGKMNMLSQARHFSRVIQFLATFNCYNFCITLTKSIKLHFAKRALESFKTCQNSHSYSNPARSYIFWRCFSLENPKKKH